MTDDIHVFTSNPSLNVKNRSIMRDLLFFWIHSAIEQTLLPVGRNICAANLIHEDNSIGCAKKRTFHSVSPCTSWWLTSCPLFDGMLKKIATLHFSKNQYCPSFMSLLKIRPLIAPQSVKRSIRLFRILPIIFETLTLIDSSRRQNTKEKKQEDSCSRRSSHTTYEFFRVKWKNSTWKMRSLKIWQFWFQGKLTVNVTRVANRRCRCAFWYLRLASKGTGDTKEWETLEMVWDSLILAEYRRYESKHTLACFLKWRHLIPAQEH